MKKLLLTILISFMCLFAFPQTAQYGRSWYTVGQGFSFVEQTTKNESTNFFIGETKDAAIETLDALINVCDETANGIVTFIKDANGQRYIAYKKECQATKKTKYEWLWLTSYGCKGMWYITLGELGETKNWITQLNGKK